MTTVLLRRSPADTTAAAEARAAVARAKVDEARALAELRRDQAAADRAARLEARQAAEAERRRRAEVRRADRAEARARLADRLASLRTVAPLLVVNAATVGGQLAYAYGEVPADWSDPVRVACAVVYALAAETVALYVGWHAHDALLAKAYATAARLRRASYAIAAVFAALNYSHFSDGWEPTAFAAALGTLSLLSPWLWGLHTRRAQHVQLVREDLVDATGAVFDPARRRAFPLRSWAARRWSIDHGVRDPREAWAGYNRERSSRRATHPAGRIRTAVTVLCGGEPVRKPAPEPVTLDDPGIRLAAQVREQVATARDRILPGAARVALADRSLSRWADVSAGQLWAMVEATHEPDHIRRPVVCRPVRPARSVRQALPAGEPAQQKAADQAGEAGRLSAAYERLTAELRREPSGTELGRAAGVSKATANRWKASRRAAA